MLGNRGEIGVLPRKIRDVYGMASMVVPYGSGAERIGGWEGFGSVRRVARGFKPRGVVRTRSSVSEAGLLGWLRQPWAKAWVPPYRAATLFGCCPGGFAPGCWRRPFRPSACGS